MGTLGKVAVVPDELDGGNITQSSARVRINPSIAHAPFVRSFLAYSPLAQRQYDRQRLGTGVPRLNVHHVRDLQIPIPPLSEQRRIAEILGVADAIRQKRRTAELYAREISRSAFFEMFGDPLTNPHKWQRSHLGELILDGPQNGIYRPAADYGSGTPIVRIDSFYDGSIIHPRGLKRVRVGDADVAKYQLREGDILINRVNSPKLLGKSALVATAEEATIYESNMMRFSLDAEMLTPVFLIHLLQTQYIKNQISTRSRDAVNQSSINQTDVKSLEIVVPPLALQQRFASVVARAKETLGTMTSSGVESDVLFKSLVQRAFRGEL